MGFDFSIVIPNYNGKKRLKKCLEDSILAAKNSQRSFEVIVVDDASTDDSCQLVSSEFHSVKLIRLDANSGFSHTANKGVFEAQGTWVLVLNNDAYLEPNYFKELFEYIDSTTENVFSVMGSIFDLSGNLIDGAKYPQLPNYFFMGGLRSTLNVTCGDRCIPTLFSSGANAFVKRDVFIELGGFDSLYSPYYLEDVDLGVSAWRMGYRSVFLPSAKCQHEVSGTISAEKRLKVKAISKRNKWVFHLKHLPLDALLGWLFVHSFELFLGLIFRRSLYAPMIKQLFPRILPSIKGRCRFKRSLRSVIWEIKNELELLPMSSQRFF